MKINQSRVQAKKSSERHWQVSYIDLLTAMLAAFTLLLALSVPDQAKLDNFASSVQSEKKAQQNLSTLAKALKENIDSNPSLRNDVKVVKTDQGVELRFGTKLLFPVGKAKMQATAYQSIDTIGQILKSFVEARSAYIAVEGHTDNTPFRSNKEFLSNWELSTARAGEVVHFLQDTVGIAGKRLSATGYADARPVNKALDPETKDFTEEAKAENRRVVIRIYYYREPD